MRGQDDHRGLVLQLRSVGNTGEKRSKLSMMVKVVQGVLLLGTSLGPLVLAVTRDVDDQLDTLTTHCQNRDV